MAAATVAIALLGLLIGSFAGVVAHRIPIGESIMTGRSRCDSCGAQVAAYDNIPLVSWLLLRGRCRHCGASIPARYPLIEAGLGAAFALTYLVLEDQGTAEVVLGLVFVTMLAIITLTDLEDRIIPNAVLLAGAGAALVITVGFQSGELGERLIAGAVAGGLLLLVALAYPRGMGMGDVKLTGVMGLFLGSAVAPAVLIGFLTGSILGVTLIAMHGAEARKQAVPFGPFLALGGLIGLLAGDEIVDWYVNAFFSG